MIEQGEQHVPTREQRATDDLLYLVGILKDPEGDWEVVRPARWKHAVSGVHVETGYSYGEGRVRVYLDGGRKATSEHTLRGNAEDLVDLAHLFYPRR